MESLKALEVRRVATSPVVRRTVSELTSLSESVKVSGLVSYPWPHLIVDNFLSEDILTQSLLEIRRDAYNFDIESRGTGQIEFSLLKSETLWRAIYSRETVACCPWPLASR
jgi:hypothetical protein